MRADVHLAAAVLLMLGCTPKSAPPLAQQVTPRPSSLPAQEVAVSQPSYQEALRAIARDIEALKGEHPQLAEFSVEMHLDEERLSIGYSYHTHRSERRGGWVAAAPNPDADGIWFHIDFHDPDSTAQIHTQPVMQELRYGDMRVAYLILEGEETKPVGEKLYKILLASGVQSGGGN